MDYSFGNMRKAIGIAIIILTILVGGILVVLYMGSNSGTYYGSIGYCNSIKLPYFNLSCILSCSFSMLLLLYWVYVEAFSRFEKQRSIFISLSYCSLIYLGYILYEICRFPYVNRSFGFVSQAEQQDGIHNPLCILGSLYAVILLVTTIRFRTKNTASRYLARVLFSAIAFFLLTVLIVFLGTNYEVCSG